jgi:hypothetical protein
MRATLMSMFRSRARATASSIERSTRGPGVTNGGVGWTGVMACGAAGVCGAGVCAEAADTVSVSTAAAVMTTFFFTKPSSTMEMK